MRLRRRDLIVGGLAASGGIMLRPAAAVAGVEDQLPPWSPGVLDIHHIDTGVGNATFVLAPDGTTMLIDCGATRGGPPASAALRPDGSRSAGEWVARYALRHARPAGRKDLDYIIATHVHPDHVGAPLPGDRRSADGVLLSGLPEVDALMPAGLVIDRGYPDYAPLSLPAALFAENHVAWLKARMRQSRRVERVRVGSNAQVRARSGTGFGLRFVGGAGQVWSGTGERSRDLLPPPARWTREATPNENHLSIAMVLSYGPFRYFTGGDLSADTQDGAYPWLDTETPIVRAAGRVDIAAADHHGYFDACGPAFTRTLDADAYVVQAWHATHPAMPVIQRLLDAWPGRQMHDVYVTRLTPESKAVNDRFVPALRSSGGHVVVRVYPDGHYRIFVTDSRDETDRVVLAGALTVPKLARQSRALNSGREG